MQDPTSAAKSANPDRTRPVLIGARDPAPKGTPPPAQFDAIRALIKAVLRVSAVSISFDRSDLLRTSGVRTGFIGVPLVRDGALLGALRVLDTADRAFTAAECALLEGFAALVVDQFELWQQASRDPLTGAMNRRAFSRDLQDAVSASAQTGAETALILFDLDHFKTCNNSFGHAAGDAALGAVAHAVAGVLRAHDSFGRLGGDEFGILLATPLAGALKVADRVRQAIAAAEVPCHRALRITASFGVAEWTADMVGADALIDAADARLYAAKQAGRNRVLGALPGRSLAVVR